MNEMIIELFSKSCVNRCRIGTVQLQQREKLCIRSYTSGAMFRCIKLEKPSEDWNLTDMLKNAPKGARRTIHTRVSVWMREDRRVTAVRSLKKAEKQKPIEKPKPIICRAWLIGQTESLTRRMQNETNLV